MGSRSAILSKKPGKPLDAGSCSVGEAELGSSPWDPGDPLEVVCPVAPLGGPGTSGGFGSLPGAIDGMVAGFSSSTGTSFPPAGLTGEGVTAGDGMGEGDGVGQGEGEGDGEGLGDGLGDGLGEGDGDGDGDGEAEGVGHVERGGQGDGEGEGEGGGEGEAGDGREGEADGLGAGDEVGGVGQTAPELTAVKGRPIPQARIRSAK